MRIVKRMLAATLSLLVLMMNAAWAEVPFLMHSGDWDLDGTPVEVLLKADVDTHMPFDEERLEMLTPITDILSMQLITGPDEGLVTVSMNEDELITLQYRGNSVQLSSMPDVTYTAQADPMSMLLGEDVSAEGGYEMLGLAREGETLLTDGQAMLAKIPQAMADYGKKSKNTTSISGYGRAAYIMDYTFSLKQAEVFQEILLSNTPDGWLHDIISGLVFSGKQSIRIHFSADDVMLRMEYNGSCGPEGELRTVKLIYKMRHDADMDKDYIELTSPAKKGKDKNNLTFERTVQTNKKGARVIEGSFKYTVVKQSVTSVWNGAFGLNNAYSSDADVINGEVTIEKKLNGADKYDTVTLAPKLTICGTQEHPVITGTMEITEKYAGRTTEHAFVSIDLKSAEPLSWTERPTTVDLAAMEDQGLAKVREEVSASIATALVRPLIVKLGKDAQWFFRDLPEEAIQAIIDSAASAVQ